ncbi:hypothetical protein AB0K60_03880 [Thermopolyspora sp. NPDC052614]|uniref:hypothetical protein n=1 Tax=Thermopolyspora sp. NPDC052614 TaxID=3155682 RepID=UPI0034286675
MENKEGLPQRTYCRPLFAYDADDGDGHGVAGVTDMFDVAERQLCAALSAMPEGTPGIIRLVILDNRLTGPEYRYLGVVARLWRDGAGGGAAAEDNQVVRER